jgi:hypothetical protein
LRVERERVDELAAEPAKAALSLSIKAIHPTGRRLYSTGERTNVAGSLVRLLIKQGNLKKRC